MTTSGAGHEQRGYLATILGTFLGAIAVGVPVGAVCLVLLGELMFSDTSDAVLIAVSGLWAAAVVVGTAWGARWYLRRRGLVKATSTGAVLAVLLTLLFVAGAVTSATDLQSSLFVPLAVAAPLMPLVARWLVLREAR